MIFEVASTILMTAISLKAYQSKSGAGNDSKKINKIFSLSGLNVKDGNQTLTAQQLKKKNYEWGTEYRYRIPLGRSFEDYLSKQKTIEAGINARKVKIQFKDLKSLKLDRNIISNIKGLYTKKLTDNKEIEILFDGLLKVRVYNEPLSKKIPWTKDFIKENTWSVLIGFNRTEAIYHDFDKRKHLIVAGATEFGKSVIMKCIITSLILSKPNDVSFSLIDLKGGSAFGRFKNASQVVNFGVNNDEALSILEDVQEKMKEDYKKIVNDGFEDVSEAGISKRHFIVIDEAADLADDKDCMEILTDIVRKGRGAGYYVIYATQYPSAQAISMQIKRNVPARLCFVLDSATASMAVLDKGGAENLPEVQGRAIYKNVSQSIIQTPLIDNKDISSLIQPFIIDKGGRVHETPKQKTGTNTFKLEKTRLS
ncbi:MULTISPECIES: FtsK/SpoIIIE domain-containing protein [unclassified Bacillus (in: firmicutes)]|uniref:FtsK/SpoIIIE domain-containing protein n=1 Tax=unclassified Bacillus (in: firmicutes) TaxID=185979 RepID=UPI001BE61D2B|nr:MULTISPECIES: FtsK/SpoIIIE domain-containing protein [unclassified Bacillus (in: firmicutes)]MBT2725134.1 cell division protein FtsK [Bacillus sp. ISL-46]MBT2744399.1 cell division protein FtsK [Bacillus sp. ISL-77]